MGRKPEELNYGLKDKDYVFLQTYLSNGLNGTQAAKEVYNCSTDNSAAVKAHKVLKKDKMREAIAVELECLGRSLNISKATVATEIAILAFSDMKNYYDFAGGTLEMKSSDELGYETRAIKKMTTSDVRLIDSEGEPYTGKRTIIELYDKKAALDLLAKMLNMVSSDKADVEINDNKIIIERKVINSKEDLPG